MSISPSLGRARRALRYRNLITSALTSSKPVVGYIGWTGEGNLGDEAMFMAHQTHLGIAATLVPLPILGANRVLTALGKRIDAICLGGGTLIGNGHFRAGLTALMDAAPNAYCFMVGTGAESLSYTTGRRSNIEEEFARWPNILSQFEDVRVRGPLTVSTLASIDVRSEATGDPALLMPYLQRPFEPGLLGLNVGVTDDQWGGDATSPEQRLVELIQLFDQAGYRVRLLPTTLADHQLMQRVASTVSEAVEVPPRPLDVGEFLAWSAACHVVVGLKLHALVLAATQHTPVIALEYRPKCRDFMMSLARDEFCMRLDQYDPAQLVAWVAQQSAHATESRRATASAVNRQRGNLTSAFGREISALVDLRASHGLTH